MKVNADTLKFAGGAVIIAAAACIMLPDVINYIGGLWRLAVMIIAVIILAWLLAYAVARVQLARQTKAVGAAKNKETEAATEESVEV